MELWDAYDEGLNKIDGIVLIRGEQIPNECFRLVCEIIVKHKDGSYLIMQRDKRKHLGGMWDRNHHSVFFVTSLHYKIPHSLKLGNSSYLMCVK